MNFALNVMHFVMKMMSFAFKTMNFVLKMQESPDSPPHGYHWDIPVCKVTPECIDQGAAALVASGGTYSAIACLPVLF